MAHLDQKMIRYISDLSRIALSKDEETALMGDLESILDYIDQLNEINTDNVEPCNHVLAEMNNVMREDEVGETMPREVFLSNAPAQIGGMIRVPPVIKGK
jgi:aspartyl-tRNA(Asn)/glutamyl-tRNA(Gln) amidotransferase subunit C